MKKKKRVETHYLFPSHSLYAPIACCEPDVNHREDLTFAEYWEEATCLPCIMHIIRAVEFDQSLCYEDYLVAYKHLSRGHEL